MYKLNKDTYGTYKEFFFSGIDESGDKQLFESFIYFSYMNEIRDKHEEEIRSIIYLPDTSCMPIDYRPKYSKEEVIERRKQWRKQYALTHNKATGEEILEETIQRAKKLALQYHRFVTLNGQTEVLANYNKNMRIKDEEQLEKRLREIAENKIAEGSIQIEDYNIKISKYWVRNYMHYPEYSIPEAQGFIMRNWTEEVYEILSYLEKAEQADSKGYYDLWLRTRIERFKCEIEKAKNALQESQENNSQNCEEIQLLKKSISESEKEIERIIPIWNKVRALRLKENSIGKENENLIIKEMDIR